jgi:hypothetical protein
MQFVHSLETLRSSRFSIIIQFLASPISFLEFQHARPLRRFKYTSNASKFSHLARCKISVCGIPFPNCDNPKKFKKFCQNNKIAPFFFLNLLYKRRNEPSWSFWPDSSSYFGTVAKLFEVQNINVHGKKREK